MHEVRRECFCSKCGETRIAPIGTQCPCGGVLKSQPTNNHDMLRKAHGPEDTDLKKGGLR